MKHQLTSYVDRLPEFLQEVTEVAGEVLAQELLCRDPEKTEVAIAIAEALAEHWQRRMIYVGDTQHRVVRLHLEICQAYDGTNIPELAEEYGLSQVQIRRILRQGRQAGWIDEPQQKLFGD